MCVAQLPHVDWQREDFGMSAKPTKLVMHYKTDLSDALDALRELLASGTTLFIKPTIEIKHTGKGWLVTIEEAL